MCTGTCEVDKPRRNKSEELRGTESGGGLLLKLPPSPGHHTTTASAVRFWKLALRHRHFIPLTATIHWQHVFCTGPALGFVQLFSTHLTLSTFVSGRVSGYPWRGHCAALSTTFRRTCRLSW